MQFGKALRAIRTSFGMSIETAAQKVGLHRSELSRYENERKNPGVNRARELAEAFDIPLFVLVALAEEEDVKSRWPEWAIAMKEVKYGLADLTARYHRERSELMVDAERHAPRFRRL